MSECKDCDPSVGFSCSICARDERIAALEAESVAIRSALDAAKTYLKTYDDGYFGDCAGCNCFPGACPICTTREAFRAELAKVGKTTT